LSPYSTLRLRTGDSFDYAILLTSLLRGAGYSAYVVVGYANHEATHANQNRLACPSYVSNSPNLNRFIKKRIDNRKKEYDRAIQENRYLSVALKDKKRIEFHSTYKNDREEDSENDKLKLEKNELNTPKTDVML
jgi:hypothetical protein